MQWGAGFFFTKRHNMLLSFALCPLNTNFQAMCGNRQINAFTFLSLVLQSTPFTDTFHEIYWVCDHILHYLWSVYELPFYKTMHWTLLFSGTGLREQVSCHISGTQKCVFTWRYIKSNGMISRMSDLSNFDTSPFTWGLFINELHIRPGFSWNSFAFIVSGMLLYFSSRRRTMLITHQFFSCCWAVLQRAKDASTS